MLRGRLFVDITPLRQSRDFRLIWIAQLASNFGRQIVVVAVAFQVYMLTHSSLAVGLIGLFQAIPVIAAGLYGGALADRYDRRRMQLVSKTGVAAGSLILAVGAIGFRAPLWSIYLIVALTAGATVLDFAGQRAMLPRLVRDDSLPAALALSAILFQAAAIIGPAAAGLILARAGPTWAYGTDVIAFVPAVALIWLVSAQPPLGKHRVAIGWGAPKGVLGYLRNDRLLVGVFVADLVAMVFGMPTAVFPQLAFGTYRIGAGGLGLLYAAPAAGALLGSVLSGWVGAIRRQGVAVLIAISVWGAAIIGFGLAGSHLWGALPLLAVAGTADLVSEIFRNTIIQLSVPDTMRGRMSAFAGMVATVGPSMGDLRAGAAAAVVGPVSAVISGGAACIVGVSVLGLALPELRRQRSRSVGTLTGPPL
jgi:MFS-type transporter involved in bile tolerance (Atg22 family)